MEQIDKPNQSVISVTEGETDKDCTKALRAEQVDCSGKERTQDAWGWCTGDDPKR